MNARVYGVLGGVLATVIVAGLITSKGEVRGQGQEQADVTGDNGPPNTEKASRPADEAAIRKQSERFTRAFNMGNARAIAALCTAGCEYYDDNQGEAFRGPTGIERAFAQMFTEQPHSRAEVEIHAIRFLSQDSALETGVVRIQLPGPTLPTSSHYRVLHVREAGRWQVAMIEERGADEEKLVDLGWLIGSWVMRGKDGEVRLNFAWNRARTRIHGNVTVFEGGRPVSSGTEVIGWDPQRGQVHSWVFNDEGGHGQAFWGRDGHQWVQETTGVLPDGVPTVATNLLTRVTDDKFTWRSVNRAVAGDPIPDRELVTAVRVKSEPARQ